MNLAELALSLGPRVSRVWLDSAANHDGLGHESFLGMLPRATWTVRGSTCTVRDHRDEVEVGVDPFESFARFCGRFGVAWGGSNVEGPIAMGYFGYELGRPTRHVARADDLPDAWFGVFDEYAHEREGRVSWRGDCAWRTVSPRSIDSAPQIGPLRCEHEVAYRNALDAVGAYLRAGDAYQVNVARRLTAPIVAPGDPLQWYRVMRGLAPAPFGAVIDTGQGIVLSGSPERFLRAHAGTIESRPIKGTRRRIGEVAADAALMRDLRTADKDSAEHLMIVDLLRNDLGRVATLGSVSVPDYGYVVELPQLYHLVSRVQATLRPDASLAEILRATFPCGSITGAPKQRVMEIIDELEPVRRGPYTGALGYVGRGEINLAVGIRLAVVTSAHVHVHVGGGIVMDSTPDNEWQETEDKAAAWRRVLAQQG